MTRDSIVDIILQRLGKSNDTTLRDEIINEMVFVQEHILEQGTLKPLWLVSEVTTTTTVADDERLQLPTDFLQEWEEGTLYLYDSTADDPWIELDKDDWDSIKAANTEAGKPVAYDIAGDYFLLSPTPDDTYTIKMRYYAKDTSLAGTYGDAANIENNWLKYAGDWFLGEVGAIIAAQYQQSDQQAAVFYNQAAKGKDRVWRNDIANREANKDRTMGDE